MRLSRPGAALLIAIASTAAASAQTDDTPRTTKGVEGLVRYDHLKPNTLIGAQVRNRTIVGVAYWFPAQGGVASALMLDYDGQTFDGFTPALAKQSKLAVHGLISF